MKDRQSWIFLADWLPVQEPYSLGSKTSNGHACLTSCVRAGAAFPPPRQCCVETTLSLPGQWGHPCLQKSCRLVTEKECLLIKSSKVEDVEPMFQKMGLDFLFCFVFSYFRNSTVLECSLASFGIWGLHTEFLPCSNIYYYYFNF